MGAIMIFKVEKRRSRQNGKLRLTRCYYLRYRIGDMPADRWKSLGVTDFQVATQNAQKFIQEREREAAGILAPKVVRDAAQKPLLDHLNDYEADLVMRNRAGRGGRGGRLLKSRITQLFQDNRWQRLADITADSFINWRKQQTHGPRTLNHYLQGMISFLNWLERGERIKFNPLKNVGKVDERGQKKRKRRAFTDEELRKLMVGSGERGLIYFTAARTGLRWDELRQLKWNEVKLEAATPIIIVREETAKNKTEEPVCLVPEIVEALKAHRPCKWSSTDLVFPQGIPRNRRLQKDAQANGIVYQDEQGRYADFHSLRYTFATFMHRNGMPANFVRKQMRHKTLRQTDGYTDEMQLPIYDSIKNLPRLGGCTQIRAQISGAEGQNGAQPVASSEGVKPHESLVNGGFCPVLSLPVATSEMERVKGIEPLVLLVRFPYYVDIMNVAKAPLLRFSARFRSFPLFFCYEL
jgi:integrase